MHRLIYLVVFLSGFTALVFETLWFRQAGLALGNSVWSATLVLGSFMGGLALGNGLVLRFGQRLARPLKTYALLELLIAASGVVVVLVLPAIGAWLAPLFRPLIDLPAALNPLRLLIAFVVLMVPATAMGATLPLLVRALSRSDGNFGRVLGALYGWNTLGAMAGVLAAEIYLVRGLGVHGASAAAAVVGLSAALIAFGLAGKSIRIAGVRNEAQVRSPGVLDALQDSRGKRILFAAFLAGAAMLALEVLWFRFLLLFQPGTSLVFAIMLATVLGGIALGGIIAAGLYALRVPVHRGLPLVAAVSALFITATYAAFPRLQASLLTGFGETGFDSGFIAAALFLMLPVSLASGVLFTGLGRLLKEEAGEGTITTAWLTLLNTLGSVVGSLLAGFLLLPLLGIESSLVAVIVVYALIAFLTPPPTEGRGKARSLHGISVIAVLMLSLGLFPYGLMKETFLGTLIAERFPEARPVASSEGLTETAVYLEYEKHGQPYYHRLMTNSYSMATTNEQSMRYMTLFVHLPVAIRPDPESALLISYGIGNTARALTATRSLQSIDVVDISRNILDLSEIVHPDPASHPLNDERVNVHIEDGRFFLQNTGKSFDLITGEPPPPTIAGVVNLYTREYFELMHDRLSPSGIASYWLPAHALEEEAAKSIIKAFCDVFEDCSLWSGAGLDWILLGSRGGLKRSTVADFSSQWDDPAIAPRLREIGVESPGQLGSLFMADADDLRQAVDGVKPVVDAHPYRILLPYSGSRQVPRMYAWLMSSAMAAGRFAESALISRYWPRELVADSLHYFALQRLVNQRYAPGIDQPIPHASNMLRQVLVDTDLEALPLWLMGSSYPEQRVIERLAPDPRYAKVCEWGLARRALAERRYAEAVRRLEWLRANEQGANVGGLDRLYRLAVELNASED
jgi:predicted membrane-bound spermidine synthase